MAKPNVTCDVTSDQDGAGYSFGNIRSARTRRTPGSDVGPGRLPVSTHKEGNQNRRAKIRPRIGAARG